MASKLLKQTSQTDLGASTKLPTYSQFIFNTSLTYNPPVVTPSKAPEAGYTKGGKVAGNVPAFDLETVVGDLKINSTDYLLINSTDKFII